MVRSFVLFLLLSTLAGAQKAPPPKESPKTQPPADASGAINGLGNSLQDLNAIRDANLARVQREGCPPDVAARLAELRTSLRKFEPAVDPKAIADNWFKPQPPPAARRESDPLSGVLPGGPSPVKPPDVAKATSPGPDEAARLKSEIGRLSAGCTGTPK